MQSLRSQAIDMAITIQMTVQAFKTNGHSKFADMLSMSRQSHVLQLAILLLTVLLVAPACTLTTAPIVDCSQDTIKPAPTATRLNDPDLSKAPESSSGGSIGAFCPTPQPISTAATDYPEQFVATELVNLSINPDDQEIEAVAVGDDMLAVAWLTDGNIQIALSRGGSHFQVREIGSGEAISLVFSAVNRLHVTYEKDGQIFYRAADEGTHPADVDSEFVADGTNPTVILNQFNYAQIVFEVGNEFHHAAQFMRESWQIGRIDGASAGSDANFTQFGSHLDLGYLIAYRGAGGDVHLAEWKTTPYGFFPTWQPIQTVSIPAGEELYSRVGVDYLEDSDNRWAVASWVTFRPNPNPPTPLFSAPIFEPANPLYPTEIGNPSHLHSGLNAARWKNDPLRPKPYSAGLYQTVAVGSGSPIRLAAWGIGDSNKRIGIDPTGGSDSNSASIIWSASSMSNQFTEFSVSTLANGSQITVYLEGIFSESETSAMTVWDSVDLQGGSLINAGFEGSFASQNGQQIPNGWTAYFEDGSFAPVTADAIYTVYSSWSSNGGASWSAPIEVIQNRETSGSLSGAIPLDVFPLISAETENPTVSFVYLYAAGNPPADSEFIRFGRPYMAQCDLISAECSQSPGDPLLEREIVRPVTQLVSAKDALDSGRATIVWTSRQSDTVSHDIFATNLVLR